MKKLLMVIVFLSAALVSFSQVLTSQQVAQWRKAAEQGHVEAQTRLGNMYANGSGVSQNYTEAVKWYRKAAEQGAAEAQRELGFMYSCGKGVAEDDAVAVKWYRKAAEQGHAVGQASLACMYVLGSGVTQDYALAYMWIDISERRGNEHARKIKAPLVELMLPEEITEGQKLSRAWMAKHPIK